MKNKYLFLYLLIAFFIFNTFNIISFFNNILWNIYFTYSDFSKANSYYEKLNSKYWYYNIANSYYKSGIFSWSINLLEDKIINNNIDYFDAYYNLANSYYKFWEKNIYDDKERLDIRQKSIDYYNKSLSLYYEEKAEKNMLFVSKKLSDLKEKIKNNSNGETENNQKDNWTKQESEKGENKDNNKTWSWSNSEENSKSSDEKWFSNSWSIDNKSKSKTNSWSTNSNNSDKTNSWTSDDKTKNKSDSWTSDDKSKNNLKDLDSKNWQDDLSKQNTLSDYQKEYLEKRKDALKEFQKNNWVYFNKKYNKDEFSKIREVFFNDPFFDNSLLDKNDTKDW